MESFLQDGAGRDEASAASAAENPGLNLAKEYARKIYAGFESQFIEYPNVFLWVDQSYNNIYQYYGNQDCKQQKCQKFFEFFLKCEKSRNGKFFDLPNVPEIRSFLIDSIFPILDSNEALVKALATIFFSDNVSTHNISRKALFGALDLESKEITPDTMNQKFLELQANEEARNKVTNLANDILERVKFIKDFLKKISI